MTITEQTIRRVIALLFTLIDKPPVPAPVPQNSSIRRFAEEYLVADANADLTCAEVWAFFFEIVQAGELPPMRKAVFLRQLPIIMEEQFQVRKCHHIEREGNCLRGFRGVRVRMDADRRALMDPE